MSTTKSLTQVALVTALIAVLGFLPPISLGFIPVPIVLQNLGVLLAAVLLGPRRGTQAIGLFLLLGLVLPVFTGGKTTLVVLTGQTAGYVLAWLLVPAAYGALKQGSASLKPGLDILLLWLSGVLLVLLIGASYLAIYSKAPILGVLAANLIFIPGDTIKVLLAVFIGRRLSGLLSLE